MIQLLASQVHKVTFELNVYKPVIMHNTLQSIYLLADGMETFNNNCAVGIEPIEEILIII